MINKKLGEPHAWISFIPMINIYSQVRAAGKPNIWILWLILGFISLLIPIIGIIIFLILYINIFHSISKRCGRGVWTTVGLFFIPFIMFPVVGYKLKENNNIDNKTEDNNNSIPKEL